MKSITSAQWREMNPEQRRKLLLVGRSRYVIDSYVGPLVAVGLRAIDRMTSAAVLPDYDEDDAAAEVAAYRAMDSDRIAILSKSESISEAMSSTKRAKKKAERDAKKAKATDAEPSEDAPDARASKLDFISMCGEMINWPAQFRALVPWSGQQAIGTLLANRLEAMADWDQSCDALDYHTGMSGVSGVMPGHAKINPLDMGFSPNALALPIATQPYREIALLIGVQFAPILKLATDLFSVQWAGDWYSWRVVMRLAPYYFAWEPETGYRVHTDLQRD